MWENNIDIYDVKVIRSRVNVFFGVGAINSFAEIAEQLLARNCRKILVITGRAAYLTSGAWPKIEPILKNKGIEFVHYDGVTPNPTTGEVDTAVALGRSAGVGAVLGIGGGSALDTAKSAAILLKYPSKNAAALYRHEFTPMNAAPVIAVNLTHGTGSEANRFAVVSDTELGTKPVIACDCIYPTWAIDDPALMMNLGTKQTRFVSIDAVNHVIEAATSKAATPYSILLAKETIRLVAEYLPIILRDPKNLTARYFLLYASMLGGISFDNGLLHYTHALEHPLSAVKPELTHGLGLAMLLPAVVENIYPEKAEILADLLAPLVPGLAGKAEEAHRAAKGVEQWLFENGATEKLKDEGFSEDDVDQLVDLTFNTASLRGLLEMAPTKANREAVAAIYLNSIQPML